MNTNTNTICKLNVSVRDNNDDLPCENDYTMYVLVDIVNGDKEEVLIDASYDFHNEEMEGYYYDEEYAKDVIDSIGLNDSLSVADMVTIIKQTMDAIMSEAPGYPEFEYEAVPASYAPWCSDDCPPETMMPYCVNNAACGKYTLNVVKDNGVIKLIQD